MIFRDDNRNSECDTPRARGPESPLPLPARSAAGSESDEEDGIHYHLCAGRAFDSSEYETDAFLEDEVENSHVSHEDAAAVDSFSQTDLQNTDADEVEEKECEISNPSDPHATNSPLTAPIPGNSPLPTALQFAPGARPFEPRSTAAPRTAALEEADTQEVAGLLVAPATEAALHKEIEDAFADGFIDEEELKSIQAKQAQLEAAQRVQAHAKGAAEAAASLLAKANAEAESLKRKAEESAATIMKRVQDAAKEQAEHAAAMAKMMEDMRAATLRRRHTEEEQHKLESAADKMTFVAAEHIVRKKREQHLQALLNSEETLRTQRRTARFVLPARPPVEPEILHAQLREALEHEYEFARDHGDGRPRCSAGSSSLPHFALSQSSRPRDLVLESEATLRQFVSKRSVAQIPPHWGNFVEPHVTRGHLRADDSLSRIRAIFKTIFSDVAEAFVYCDSYRVGYIELVSMKARLMQLGLTSRPDDVDGVTVCVCVCLSVLVLVRVCVCARV